MEFVEETHHKHDNEKVLYRAKNQSCKAVNEIQTYAFQQISNQGGEKFHRNDSQNNGEEKAETIRRIFRKNVFFNKKMVHLGGKKTGN